MKFLKQRLHLQHGLQPRFRQRLLYKGNTLDDAVRLDSTVDFDAASVTFCEESESKQRSPATSEQKSVGDAALKRQLDPGDSLPPPCRQKLLQEHGNSNDSMKLNTVMDLQVLILPFSGASKRQQKELYQAARSGVLDEAGYSVPCADDNSGNLDLGGFRFRDLGGGGGGRSFRFTTSGVKVSGFSSKLSVGRICKLSEDPRLPPSELTFVSGEVEALLQLPRDPDAAVDAFGRTPLMHASERGHIEVVELLLEARAQVDSRLFSGKPSCFVYYVCFSQAANVPLECLPFGKSEPFLLFVSRFL